MKNAKFMDRVIPEMRHPLKVYAWMIFSIAILFQMFFIATYNHFGISVDAMLSELSVWILLLGWGIGITGFLMLTNYSNRCRMVAIEIITIIFGVMINLHLQDIYL